MNYTFDSYCTYHGIPLKHTTAQEHEHILQINPDVFHRVRIPTYLTINITGLKEVFCRVCTFVNYNNKH